MVDENNDLPDENKGHQVIEIVPVTRQGEETGQSEGSKKRPLIVAGVIALAVVLIAAVYVIWFRTGRPQTEAKEEIVVSVKVAKAEKDAIAQDISAVGNVVPAEQSTVAASIAAQIRQMGLLKNHVVKKGDLLAVLSSEDLVAQRNEAAANLEEAKLNLQTLRSVTIPQAGAQSDKDISDTKATLDNARAVYERRKILFEKGGISLKELESSRLAMVNAENAYNLALKYAGINRGAVNPNSQAIAAAKIKQSQDRLAALDVQVKRGEIRAPISGIVTDQFQYEGEFASQGAKLLTISDIGTVIVKAQFSDTVVKDLKVGDVVTIFPTQTPDERMTGRVTLISRASDPQSRSVEVWANFGNPRGLLLANGAVSFTVSSKATQDALVVPVAAVTLDATNSDEGTVMVVGRDSIAREKKVKVGIKSGGKIQIVEGINDGETVVIEGNYALPDGTKVEIAEDSKDDKKSDGDDK